MTRMHMRQWLTIPHITSALNAGKWVTLASTAASLSQKDCLVKTGEEAVGPHGRFESDRARNMCMFWESNPKYQSSTSSPVTTMTRLSQPPASYTKDPLQFICCCCCCCCFVFLALQPIVVVFSQPSSGL
jgi:hypothetical protein